MAALDCRHNGERDTPNLSGGEAEGPAFTEYGASRLFQTARVLPACVGYARHRIVDPYLAVRADSSATRPIRLLTGYPPSPTTVDR